RTRPFPPAPSGASLDEGSARASTLRPNAQRPGGAGAVAHHPLPPRRPTQRRRDRRDAQDRRRQRLAPPPGPAPRRPGPQPQAGPLRPLLPLPEPAPVRGGGPQGSPRPRLLP